MYSMWRLLHTKRCRDVKIRDSKLIALKDTISDFSWMQAHEHVKIDARKLRKKTIKFHVIFNKCDIWRVVR